MRVIGFASAARIMTHRNRPCHHATGIAYGSRGHSQRANECRLRRRGCLTQRKNFFTLILLAGAINRSMERGGQLRVCAPTEHRASRRACCLVVDCLKDGLVSFDDLQTEMDKEAFDIKRPAEFETLH